MTDRDIMQQALDALCDIIPANANRKEIDRIQHAAITALRERLAEPVQEPVLETVYETIIQWDEGGGKRSRRELARRIVALYTATPQRRPLSDEQMWELWNLQGDDAMEQQEAIAFARAIEAAHGIKE